MLVKDLFTLLSYGELSNLSMSSDGSGSITEEHHGKMISYINTAVQQLYQRFVIRENVVMLLQYEDITTYHLEREFALSSDSNAKYKYILDLDGEPFNEDEVIRVLEATDSLGRIRYINQPDRPLSLFSPSPLRVQVPSPVSGQGLAITYQAKAAPLLFDGLKEAEYLNQPIKIPSFFNEALQNYVAHLVYTFMNGQEYRMYGQEFFAKFENLCNQIKENNLTNYTPSTQTYKFSDRGFI